MALADLEVRERVAQLEALLAELEQRADAPLHETIQQALRLLIELHGEGLERIISHLQQSGAAELQRELCSDEWIAQLLLLHSLHPESTAVRAERALEAVRPLLRTHGGDVEWIGVAGAVARVRLTGSCNGCASASQTLRRTVEEALRSAAPELERIEAEAGPATAPAWIPLASLDPDAPSIAPEKGVRS